MTALMVVLHNATPAQEPVLLEMLLKAGADVNVAMNVCILLLSREPKLTQLLGSKINRMA